ncbi:MAG: 50S ribosomal protein L25, partial [Bacillota bacterium]|nr:50S ribosomal protein L25 [Bacillota bacterium]
GRGENRLLKVEARALNRLVHEGAVGHLVDLSYTRGEKKQTRPVLIKEIQRDPVRGHLLHVDFHAVAMDEPVTTMVPVVLTGEGRRVSDGGIIQHGIRELEISCLPVHIPEHIEVDVSGLKLGESLKVGDLKVSKEIQILTPPEDVVVSVVAPAKAGEAEALAEEAAEAGGGEAKAEE